MDQVLITSFNLHVNESVKISVVLLIEQDKVFHEEVGLQYKCEYSEGWLYYFKLQHGLQFHVVCGEKHSENKVVASAYVDEIAKLVNDEYLSPEQVYNADKTALFWRFTSKRILTTDNATGAKRCKLLIVRKNLHLSTFKGITVSWP